jgi:hypothetical protein
MTWLEGLMIGFCVAVGAGIGVVACAIMWSVVSWLTGKSQRDAVYAEQVVAFNRGSLLALETRNRLTEATNENLTEIVSALKSSVLTADEWWAAVVAECDEPGRVRPATCGTPTADGYRNTCGQHQPKETT